MSREMRHEAAANRRLPHSRRDTGFSRAFVGPAAGGNVALFMVGQQCRPAPEIAPRKRPETASGNISFLAFRLKNRPNQGVLDYAGFMKQRIPHIPVCMPLFEFLAFGALILLVAGAN
ncbi:hypothetical protein Ga0609869_002674 [Rhodovulum iodosum]|uniref:Uncharacterized protein n=1 Tax=Rhodovulum iodosum TaxID=68291 RepID=A0ABV3XVE6_9RHOB|nr:hypothetical protein [Rhodovulum robiginosum]RSK33503.1 hypothetical protein EJA01_09415 [Rhodovulum robiginosum]